MDDRLKDIVERWEEMGWFDKKYILWICFKRKHGITGNQILSLATAISIAIVLSCKQCPSRTTGLLAIIVLLYFYVILIEHLLNRGKIA